MCLRAPGKCGRERTEGQWREKGQAGRGPESGLGSHRREPLEAHDRWRWPARQKLNFDSEGNSSPRAALST